MHPYFLEGMVVLFDKTAPILINIILRVCSVGSAGSPCIFTVVETGIVRYGEPEYVNNYDNIFKQNRRFEHLVAESKNKVKVVNKDSTY